MLDNDAVCATSGHMVLSPWSALAGGALIGASASALLVLNGRIAGISGIVGGVLRPRTSETAWQRSFIAGLLAGGLLLAWCLPESIAPRDTRVPTGVVALAGLLVGFGTQLGSGCTSGHGVCGIGRMSLRSVAAVVTFMTTGAIAAFFVRHILLPRL
jgi:uncharacterized membrane protein YedE/YeeE